jgi:murein lipoprotein
LSVDLLFIATHLHGRIRPKADIARNSQELPHLHNPSTYYNVIMSRQKGRYMSDIPGEGGFGMFLTKQNLAMARALGVAMLAAVCLGGCATYKDEFATINSRLDSLDAKVQSAAQSAESANQSAQQANQRLDQMEGRIQRLEAAPPRKPRG